MTLAIVIMTLTLRYSAAHSRELMAAAAMVVCGAPIAVYGGPLPLLLPQFVLPLLLVMDYDEFAYYRA